MSFFQTGSLLVDGRASTATICDRFERSRTSSTTPSVFIVDEDQAACEPLAALISREGWRPERFTSGEEFLAHPVELSAGCLILDVSLPGLSGLELQKRAAVKCPHIPTIFLSAYGDIPKTVEAMKGGAHEFLTKPFRDNEVLSAIRECLVRSRLVVAKKSERQALQGCYASLSLRQRQVMVLVSCGLMNKQVAAELGISEITVKAHRGQVMQKMQANSLPDLVRMAGRLGLATSRTTTMMRDHADHASYAVGQFTASYAFVTKPGAALQSQGS
jgi:FixJ family two-component response regulator